VRRSAACHLFSAASGNVVRLGLMSLLALVCTSAQAEPSVALFWAPPGPDAPTLVARAALSRAIASHQLTLVDVATELPEPSLREALRHAIDAYRGMHLDEAWSELERISAEAGRTGGGDLDRRSLGDLFLYLALVQQERSHNDLAWDAFVEAATLDPTRTLDPAEVPPRAATAHHRAIAELARAPRVDVSVHAPSGSRIRIDGGSWDAEAAALVLPGGIHYVQIRCDGYEPWRGTLDASPPRAQLAPSLRPLLPPTLDAVAPPNQPTVLGAIYRRANGPWRMVIRSRAADGRTLDVGDELVGDVEQRVAALVEIALVAISKPGALALAPPAIEHAPPKRSWTTRWWIWTIAGASVTAVAVGLSVGLTRGGGAAPGTVGGSLEPIR
jgi:hypothetical protein